MRLTRRGGGGGTRRIFVCVFLVRSIVERCAGKRLLFRFFFVPPRSRTWTWLPDNLHNTHTVLGTIV